MNSPVHPNSTASAIDATAIAQVEAVLLDDCNAYTDDCDAQIEPTHRELAAQAVAHYEVSHRVNW